jgi:NAD(P)H-quinone oxidoreductase subunit 5
MQEIWLSGMLIALGGWLVGGGVLAVWARGGVAARLASVTGPVGRALELSLVAGLLWLAGGLGAWLLQGGPMNSAASQWRFELGGWTLLAFDGLAWVMSLLVAFLGWVVVRYSRQYLAGDSRQASYWGWLSATIAAVLGMVSTGNLLLLLTLWTLASLTLHQLLLFHRDRPVARRAAGTKFTFSRLADVFLYGGGALLCWRSGTWELSGLQAWASELPNAELAWLNVACLLLAFGAAIRSAQVPFHFWLPLTLETPTPVSALMHAGIVNAGGFMAIRLSFLLVESPWAMNLLALLGLMTAMLAGAVMLTQTSIKSMLAWSTVAQMGFMMLQCGCGAFSAALLHIVAHSLYKAHAFLGSGSVLGESTALEPRIFSGRALTRGSVTLSLLLAAGLVLGAFAASGVSLWDKQGGVLLAGALCCGIAHWLQGMFRLPQSMAANPWVWMRGLAIAFGLVAVYVAGWQLCGWLLQPPAFQPIGLALPQVAVALWGLLFAVMIWLRGDWGSLSQFPVMEAWRVHASQGFYLESIMRRWLGGVAPSLLR